MGLLCCRSCLLLLHRVVSFYQLLLHSLLRNPCWWHWPTVGILTELLARGEIASWWLVRVYRRCYLHLLMVLWGAMCLHLHQLHMLLRYSLLHFRLLIWQVARLPAFSRRCVTSRQLRVMTWCLARWLSRPVLLLLLITLVASGLSQEKLW